MEYNTQAPACFTVKNLSFAYDSKQILQNLNICIPKGKVVTLMGPNGCGKSTLFQLLTKNLTPTTGDIYYGDTPITAFTLRDFAKKIAIVHQNNSAPNDMTVEQLVSYGRIPYTRMGRSISKEKDMQMVERAMKITGITSLRNRSIAAISGGQKQRVWIAMALAQGTKTLLLDEPTTYLDIRYQLQILKLVKMLNEHFGISIIMVLHDINQAIAYSDEIIALSAHGSIVAQGNPKEILTTDVLKQIYGIELPVIAYDEQKLVLTI